MTQILEDVTFNKEMCQFLTKVKKLDGTDFPVKTLYDIVICLQFHLEKQGFSWRLLNDQCFTNIYFTLDNLMKNVVQKVLVIKCVELKC